MPNCVFTQVLFYRKKDIFELHQLVMHINADLKKADDCLTKTWYLKFITKLDHKIAKRVEGLPTELRKNLIHCASNVISIQVCLVLIIIKFIIFRELITH